MNRVIGLAIIIGGLCLVFAGLLIYTGWLSWFGRLPGDVYVRRGNFSFYFPLATSIILSIILTLLLAFFRR